MGTLLQLKISGIFFRRFFYLLTLLFAMVFIIGGCAWAATPVTGDNDRLQQLEKRLRESKEQAASSQHQENKLLAELHEISRDRHRLELETRSLEQQIKALEFSMADEERKRQRVSAALNRQRRRFNHRLKVRYMIPPGVVLQKILGHQKLKDTINQISYLKYVLMYDRQQLTGFTHLLQEHQQIKRRLEEQRRQMAEAKKKKRLKLAVLEENIAKKNKLLYKIKEKKEYYAALVKELAEAAEKLRKIVAARPKSSLLHGSLAKFKGRLPMPTHGVVVRFFGLEHDRRFKTVTQNKGIDIEAPLGTEVKAIFPGQVVFASWLKGYGNLIIIDHGGGYYSIYGHLLEFKTKVNAKIHQHDVIGSVGDTDSLIGPALYFEIRRHGRPQDPLEWVSPMARG